MNIEEIKKQLDENSKKIIDNMNKVHQNSGAIEILKDFKGDNKRIFIILMVVLFMWFATICGFLYYVYTTGFEEEYTYANTNDGGNACIGDNCNNGEVSYGNSSKEN